MIFFLYLTKDVNVPPKIYKQKKINFCSHLEGHWRKKQDPDRYQNITDLQHWNKDRNRIKGMTVQDARIFTTEKASEKLNVKFKKNMSSVPEVSTRIFWKPTCCRSGEASLSGINTRMHTGHLVSLCRHRTPTFRSIYLVRKLAQSRMKITIQKSTLQKDKCQTNRKVTTVFVCEL